jgi:hypothetical protein
MTVPPAADPKLIAVKAIIDNSRRLLRDAQILQHSGSAGSALSLAILAFEEAGKGHIVEHGWEKPKQARSHHSFRHVMAFTVLLASFNQKYGLDTRRVGARITKRFEDAGVKAGGKIPIPPMTDDLRMVLRAELLPQLERLTAADREMLGVEQRWLEKVGHAVHRGTLEKIRQSGLYLDTNDRLGVTSSPDSVDAIDVERWIWAATRVLNLLEHGEYAQPYSPLSELMSAARNGDEAAARMLSAMQVTAAEASKAPDQS